MTTTHQERRAKNRNTSQGRALRRANRRAEFEAQQLIDREKRIKESKKK